MAAPPSDPAGSSLGRVVEIVPRGPLGGRLDAPPSKSVTNRLLVVAALAEGTSTLTRPLESDDTEAMVEGLRSFGVTIAAASPVVAVEGSGGRLRTPVGPLDARQSGTTLRFLAPLTLVAGGTTTLDGSPSLRRRPIGGLAEALAELGAEVATSGGFPPMTVRATGFPGGAVRVDAGASSQFVSALLMAAPYADSDLEIEVAGLGAGGYVELTLDVMRRFGAAVRGDGDRFVVSCRDRYEARDEVVEYDASAAAHLLALAVATAGEVTVTNARGASLQPDAGVVEVLAAMGAEVDRGEHEVRVRGPQAVLPVEADLSGMPDQLPTLATLAALSEGTSCLSGLAVTRGHETDRLAAVAEELRKLGADVRAGADWLEVRGGPLHGGDVETYEDHRMAMAFTALGARVPGIRVLSPGCVAKTYPRFFDDAARLGLGLRLGS